MKYIYLLFLFVSFANLAENNLSYRAKFTVLEVDTELNYQGLTDLYVGDFLVSNTNTKPQKITLNESLSVFELGMSYNWKYLILSADYSFNIAGDKRQNGENSVFENPVDEYIFGEDAFTTNSTLLVQDVDYQSGQASIGFSNGNMNVFAGYKVDTKITTMNVNSTIEFFQAVGGEPEILTLDNVLKGPFAGVSLLYDITDNSYIAVKLAVTQYESGHLMLSNDSARFNEPLTGKALSFSTKWTGKRFFVGFQSKFYKSDSSDELSVERSEIGLDLGVYFL
ncbi:hypothetical protein GCM10008107_09700 [Psychrosphaera saromensis]|uniref:Uncharacterized protein n=1 Tax=Psychrosphaera saromensis TaxID=716813 RepID=A0A2S7UUY0_9GAMM|nr:hypothetical protein [Psychrosphaera saromensis]PQJ53743.1 hypothetical protein BTO11_08755 [Psychrosphaera saromensis]GHB62663.1 hypothetical protein GCM10008107_09700 [Psychrosphaera saromensis]GLQ15473.1 hypothetical protein GCM10007917_29280 [Psychrosphaera saromensis]